MFVLTVLQWKVLQPLKDLEVNEMEEAIFECEFSVPNVMVTWTINGERIEPSPKFMIDIERTKHRLTVTKCKPKDGCHISCSYAKLKTEADLVVNGEFMV